MTGRLSKPIGDIQPHYDAVVVGSGYGGGVAASRLARCGLKVCVLERGREFPTGSFPARLSQAQAELQITGAKTKLGRPTGLFDFRLGEDIHILVGCGLGGTSLINANVCLEPDKRVFEDPVWPPELSADGALTEGFGRARRMLRPVPYPRKPRLYKLMALAAAAGALGQKLEHPPLHVTFAPGLNAAGVMQQACTLCGDCCAGCNVGAKTTAQLTYLPDAVLHGADIFTGAQARSVQKWPSGKWRVLFQRQDGPENAGAGAGAGAALSVSADIVVLAAGTLGSTEILLRSQAEGLALSERLGERFSGNADVIAIGYNNDVPVNGTGVGHPPKTATDPVGPAVAGLIDLRNTPAPADGLAIVEASTPSAMAPLLPFLLAPGAPLLGADTDGGISDELDETGRALASLVGGAYRGAVRNTQTFLAIGHDSSSGRMHLRNGRLAVEWPHASSQAVYQRIEDTLKRAVAATGGTYLPNPAATKLLGQKLLSVHPLGGCVMGRDRAGGVVNHKCQVFDGAPDAAPESVHAGLYVCDGAVMPRSLGIHPLLTITAVAERAMLHLAQDAGFALDDAPRNGAPWLLYATPEQAAPIRTGIFARLKKMLWG